MAQDDIITQDNYVMIDEFYQKLLNQIDENDTETFSSDEVIKMLNIDY